MTIENAIKLAIEGGWDDTDYAFSTEAKQQDAWKVNRWEYDSKIFIDPLFWQALGKSMEWEGYFCTECEKEGLDKYNVSDHCDRGYRKGFSALRATHMRYWHKLIDHIADGGTIESYFETL